MRIVATADLHGDLPNPDDLPKCDVFIIAGDVCPSFDHSTAFQRSWLETNFEQWLMELPAAVILGIGGNHDFELERNEKLARSLSWLYLKDERVSIDGFRFYGLPWVPNLSTWAFHLDDVRLDEKFAEVPDYCDVVISHGPPFGYCDRTVPRYGNVNAGFPGMLRMLDRVQPKLLVCGHIHEGYGYEVAGSTVIANVSHMTETYEPINDPGTFFLKRDRPTVVFHGLPRTPYTGPAEAFDDGFLP